MATQRKKNSKLLDYAFLKQDIPEEIQKLDNKEIFLWQFKSFMSDVDVSFSVFDSKQLNDELLEKFYRLFFLRYFDQVVSIEPEYFWKMYFERMYLQNIDRYNKLLRLQLVELNNIEDKLYENVNMTNKFDEDTLTNEKENKLKNEKENVKRQTDTDKKRDQETDFKNRDFKRDIFEETPNGQLNLSSQDGSGVISTATNIDESLENQTTNTKDNQVSNENRKDNQDLINDQDTKRDRENKFNKDNLRVLKGYQNLGSKGKLLDDYQKLFSNTLDEFCNCFDKLFKHVY